MTTKELRFREKVIAAIESYTGILDTVRGGGEVSTFDLVVILDALVDDEQNLTAQKHFELINEYSNYEWE